MYALIIPFAASLFLLALFFAVKEREVYSGTDTRFTRFLERHSPAAQAFAMRTVRRTTVRFQSLLLSLERIYDRTLHAIVWGTRALVVALAERMIHAVRGEKLLSMRSTSSMYLKHLKEHKDSITNGDQSVQ